MSFGHVIDLEGLLNPISAAAPAGIDLREDRSPGSLYYTLKDARNNARATERSSLFDDGVDLLKSWHPVAKLAPQILTRHSKDLEVACWLTEGLVRLHGAAGLRDGFRLIHGLVSNFWPALYPLPDEDGLETPLAPLTGLNGDGGEGTLLAPLRNMDITNAGDLGGFNLWQYQKARDNARLTDEDERASRTQALGFNLQDIENTVREAAPEFFAQLIATLEDTLAHYKDLHDLLRHHCGKQTPPSSNIAALLDEVLRTVRFLSKDKLQVLMTTGTNDTADDDSVADGNSVPGYQSSQTSAVTGPIAHREDALRRLQEVADYFRTHEPHTPLAPGIERLIRWGRMTVAELMMELLPEDASRGFFSQLTGLKLDGSDGHKYVTPPAPVAAAVSGTDASGKAAETEAAVPQAEHSW